MLIAVWHDLIEVRQAESQDSRALFRHFAVSRPASQRSRARPLSGPGLLVKMEIPMDTSVIASTSENMARRLDWATAAAAPCEATRPVSALRGTVLAQPYTATKDL